MAQRPIHSRLIAWSGLDAVLNLERRAAEAPDQPALVSPGRKALGYAELVRLLETFRAQLIRCGLIPGQSLAMVFPNGPDFVTTVLASSGLGACAPLDPSLTDVEYEFHLSRLRSPVLLIPEGFDTPAISAARRVGMRILRLKFARDYHLASVRNEGETSMRDLRVSDACLLLFTSATTGRSKLVPLTAANFAAQWENDRRFSEINEHDVFLNLVPMFNLLGIGGVLTQLYCGGTAVCVSEFDPLQLPAWIMQFRPTWMAVNAVWHRSLETLVRHSPGLWSGGPLRFIRSGGAAPNPELVACIERDTGVPVLEVYGMSEAGGIARSLRRSRKPGSAGRAAGTRFAIFDTSDPGELQAVAQGKEGEILVRGPNVMSGYLDDEEANRDAFIEGWFRTGDLGRLDSEGFLFITGRLKEIIVRAGAKIIPQDVDRVLRDHPGVADAAVFPIPHPTLGQDIAAAVVRNASDPQIEELGLKNFVAGHAAAYKVPRHIMFVDQLPRGATGRIQRKKLAEQFQTVLLPGAGQPVTQLNSEIAIRLIGVWKRILKAPRVALADGFYDLGGDSLSASLMMAEVQREFNIGPELLDRIEFFDKPTIASLSQIVAETRTLHSQSCEEEPPGEGACRILALNAAGSQIPMFCFPASDSDPFYFRHLAKAFGPDQPCFVISPPLPVEGNRLLAVEEVATRAIRAIRAKQPSPPYLLLGHCFGGVIAAEVSHQLCAAGSTVPGLILIDSLTPGYPKLRGMGTRYVKVGRAALQGQFKFSLRDVAAHLRRLALLGTRKVTARRYRTKIARSITPAIRSISSQFLLNRAVVTEYDVPQIEIPVVHFLARDHKVDSLVLCDPRFGWRDFVRAGIEERWVPGDHNSLLMNENARGLAEGIRSVLKTTFSVAR